MPLFAMLADVWLLDSKVKDGTLDLLASVDVELVSGNREGLSVADAAGLEVTGALESANVGLFSAGAVDFAVGAVSVFVLAGTLVAFVSSAMERCVLRDFSGSRIAMMPAVTKARINNIKMMPLDQCSHQDRESFSADSGIGRTTGVERADAGVSNAVVGEMLDAADEKLGRAPGAEPNGAALNGAVPNGVAAKAEPAKLPATATLLATVPATAPVTAPAT